MKKPKKPKRAKKFKKSLYVDIHPEHYGQLQRIKYCSDQPMSFIVGAMIEFCEKNNFEVPQKTLQDELRAEKRKEYKAKMLEKLPKNASGTQKS